VRKTLTALFLMMCLIVCGLHAQAEVIFMQAEDGQGGRVEYPASQDESFADLMSARLGTDDALILLRSGAQIDGTSEIYTFEKDGVQYASVCFTQTGKIRFGRYGQVTHTMLVNLTDGTEAAADAVFGEMQALSSFLDEYVEFEVLPALNTYLDASELLPVPLDAICFAADGLTVHYPADRFSFFSGNSGAIEIKYHELTDAARAAVQPAVQLPLAAQEDTAAVVLACAAKGALAGVEGVTLEDKRSDVLQRFGTLTDPDYIAGGEIYEVEEPRMRGVHFITARDAQADEDALLQGIRSQRVNMHGLMTGISLRSECIDTLGAPESSVTLDASAAESYRVAAGCVDSYPAGEYILQLYYDAADVLFAAQIGRR